MQCNLKVDLTPCDVPIVGYEMKADAALVQEGSSVVPQHSLHFNWYREQSCFVHPSEVATIQCMSSGSAFGNGSLLDGTVVEQEGKSWIKVGSSNIYAPSTDDCGFRLRLESVAIDCTEGGLLAPLNITVTDLVIAAPVFPRRMIQMGPLKGFRKFNNVGRSSVAGTFSVLSYNVLSDIYARCHSHCPKWALTWEYRRRNLLREITGYEADILCLQEVQNDHFENFFEPELVRRGYSVIYKGKNHEVVYTAGSYKLDGCATCFRRDRFKEIMKYELEFQNIAQSVVGGLQSCQNSNDGVHLMKDNVALIVVLEPKKHAFSDALHSRICVANTHIHSVKDHTDVKLWQVATLINGLEEIVNVADIPLLICGDLNSLPGSAPHTLLAKRNVEPNHEEMARDPLGVFPTLKLNHSLSLVSAYSSLISLSNDEKQQRMINPQTREPVFTNCIPGFSGTLDYIFYTENSLKVEGLLELLDLESTRETALPSPQWPSDHIALMAIFSMAPFYPTLNQTDPPPVFPLQIEKKSNGKAKSASMSHWEKYYSGLKAQQQKS